MLTLTALLYIVTVTFGVMGSPRLTLITGTITLGLFFVTFVSTIIGPSLPTQIVEAHKPPSGRE